MKDIIITSEYIKLDQFLKLANIVGSGGEAKIVISQAEILVNGEPENRRGTKLRGGDIISFEGDEYRIVN